mmetsp:Transcript_19215/g.52790  ORF Transcript_19215/g.52790 Transcript_19215/m.52790 type:complete len:230 (+) Transcript_19215:1485-2174(+)
MSDQRSIPPLCLPRLARDHLFSSSSLLLLSFRWSSILPGPPPLALESLLAMRRMASKTDAPAVRVATRDWNVRGKTLAPCDATATIGATWTKTLACPMPTWERERPRSVGRRNGDWNSSCRRRRCRREVMMMMMMMVVADARQTGVGWWWKWQRHSCRVSSCCCWWWWCSSCAWRRPERRPTPSTGQCRSATRFPRGSSSSATCGGLGHSSGYCCGCCGCDGAGATLAQ